ncbi:hypothetical protein [Marivita sp. S2033]|uniref:hypothetical protein n=1 Tax=Marivita sp. S2033 TaxID=3373187 RepID=UPI003981B411
MTQSKPTDDALLDAAFTQARHHPPAVPDGLMARVTEDAVAHIPDAPRKVPLWRQVIGTLGGWPAMAGLGVTACVGIWVGGTVSDDVLMGYGVDESIAFEIGDGIGAFDLLLLDS